jgi:triphosphoribosyl-dephospho-CoA synthase
MIKELFKQACLEELQAIKPGNVHAFADGHDMTVEDFILSAKVAADEVVVPGLSLGERILTSVQATQSAVKCNTNLGIILLCAPLIHASQKPHGISLAEHLKEVLQSTTIADADLCFKAIALANPAGLGERVLYDVNKPANCTLLQAMLVAAERDMVARQYSDNFAEIFEFGLPNYEHAFAHWQKSAWATTYVYLSFLANYLDSHIVRKYGEVLAKAVQSEAKQHLEIFAELGNPKTYLGELLRWDADLKARKINPGTCADLTVATLLAIKLKEQYGHA